MKRRRKQVAHFYLSGIAIEGTIEQALNGWYTLKAFFSGNLYKVRASQLVNGYASAEPVRGYW
jgi:hypothetical protein